VLDLFENKLHPKDKTSHSDFRITLKSVLKEELKKSPLFISKELKK